MIVEIVAIAAAISGVALRAKGRCKASGYVGVPWLFRRGRHVTLNDLAGELVFISGKNFGFRYLGIRTIVEIGAVAGLIRAMPQSLVEGSEPIVANARRRWLCVLIGLGTTLLAYRVEIFEVAEKIAARVCRWQGVGLRIFVPVGRCFSSANIAVFAY